MLESRPVPKPSPQFTIRTMARIRRARWRRDQFLDAGFNVAIGAIVLAVVGGIWLLLNRSGLVAVSSDAVNLFGGGMMTLVHRVAPSLPLYAGAMAVLGTALVLWWWAERDAAL